jgi:hypothetical protein
VTALLVVATVLVDEVPLVATLEPPAPPVPPELVLDDDLAPPLPDPSESRDDPQAVRESPIKSSEVREGFGMLESRGPRSLTFVTNE